MKKLLLFLLFAVPVRAQMSAPLNSTSLNMAGGTTDFTNYISWEADTGSSGQVVLKMQNSPAGGAGYILVDSSGRLRWIANTGGGGFSNPMTTLGDLIYENATPAAARLAGNTNNYIKFLSSTASSGTAQAPAWSAFVTDYGLVNSAFVNASANAVNAGGADIGIGPSTFAAANSSAIGDVAIGPSALQSITSSTHDVAVGTSALAALVTNGDCTADGWDALAANTAAQCTALGSGALASNTSGARNYAAGFNSGNSNTTGADNTFTGTNSGKTATGSQNTLTGSGADNGYTNITSVTGMGYNVVASGSSSVAIGVTSSSTQTGSIAVGGSSSSSGAGSISIGLGSNASNDGSISLGDESGHNTQPGFYTFGIGGDDGTNPIKYVYIGDGQTAHTASTPDNVLISTSQANGTNKNSGSLTLAPGLASGNAHENWIYFASSLAVASGAGLQTLFNVAGIDSAGFTLLQPTAATSGVTVEKSPILELDANAWSTTATAADSTINWQVQNVPISSANPIISKYTWSSGNTGLGYTPRMTLSTTGDIGLSNHVVTTSSIGSVSDDGTIITSASAAGSDIAGAVTLTLAASAGTGTATVSFAKTYGTAPYVVLTPGNAAAQSIISEEYVTSTATTFTINLVNTASSATNAIFNYIVVH